MFRVQADTMLMMNKTLLVAISYWTTAAVVYDALATTPRRRNDTKTSDTLPRSVVMSGKDGNIRVRGCSERVSSRDVS